MALPLRQSTASQEILLGPFVDDADGDTQMTALTIANTDIKLFKHGASAVASKNSGGATHDADGRYVATLDATDTNTLGMLEVHVHVADALPVKREYIVYPAVVFDALFLGTDNLQVDVVQWEGADATDTSANWEAEAGPTAADIWGYVGGRTITGGTVTAVDTGAIVAASFGADAIDANALKADAIAEIADQVWDEDATGHQTQGTFGQAIGDPAADSSTIWDLANTNLDAAVSTRLATAGYTAPPSVATILTTQMTESYAADGAAPTLAQALFLIQQMLGDFSISGTTLTVKKIDGSTTAGTFTLNDSSSPTSITRAT